MAVRPKSRSPLILETLEARTVPATFLVANLNDSGIGSFRQALVDANGLPGPDAVQFQVGGVVTLASDLPAITDPVSINALKAGSYLPTFQVDAANHQGLVFAAGSKGSSLQGLSITAASGDGVVLNDSQIQLSFNHIGVALDGVTPQGNGGNGILVSPGSTDNTLGYGIPSSQVVYFPSTGVPNQPVYGWEGLRAGINSGEFLAVGTTSSGGGSVTGLVYTGPIFGNGGSSFSYSYPNSSTTTIYGPDLLAGGVVRLVGTYKVSGSSDILSFIADGTLAELSAGTPSRLHSVTFEGMDNTVMHSTAGGLAVGNANDQGSTLPIAILYDVAADKWLENTSYPGSLTTSSYGIWHNGGTSYTITGGYYSQDLRTHGFLVDYDLSNGQYTNWTTFDYPNPGAGKDYVTHFEGISSVEDGVYTLSATSLGSGTGTETSVIGSWVQVRRLPGGGFDSGNWVDLEYPASGEATYGNSVYGNAVVGIVGAASFSYQAEIFLEGQSSNVISANAGNGIALIGTSGNRVGNNRIGTDVTGSKVLGNGMDGILLQDSKTNLIGNEDPVTSIDYYNTSALTDLTVTAWQGLRGGSKAGEYLFAGTSGEQGLYFQGSLDLSTGVSALINFPGASSTSLYGPDLQSDGSLNLVGSYKNAQGTVSGFFSSGTLEQLAGQTAAYQTISYPGYVASYAHSTMGGLVVGGSSDGGSIAAWIYDSSTSQFLTDIVYPDSVSTNAYGIWDNGDGSFTICGGYEGTNRREHAFLVNYSQLNGGFSNWATFDFPDPAPGQEVVSHFEGISSTEKGVYNLAGMALDLLTGEPVKSAWVSVRQLVDGTYDEVRWVPLQYPDDPSPITANAVYGTAVVGVGANGGDLFAYQANLNIGFTLSNLISGNAGNGIHLVNSGENLVGMNQIGTDLSGLKDLGNQGSGILLEDGSRGNLIGGQATNGNDPTGDVFARPPMGNLISGNDLYGVLIRDSSEANLLCGNFIGTDGPGSRALGNGLDGVAIVDSDFNALIGCTFEQNPFVYYNVISGNGGNGVRVHNSDEVTIHANFMGVGADNASLVPNALNGLLVEGNSANTQVGGVIPLGNVIAGNTRNGIEVRDTASGFVTFNTFAGLFAFGTAAPNGGDGILITSTGGNNLVRTNIVSGNASNGIHISGNATGVTVDPNFVGLNTFGSGIMPNGKNGLLIDGNAHGNIIGGNYLSVMPQNTFSANNAYGIAFGGTAHDNIVFNSVVGLDLYGLQAFGNSAGGVYMGPNTHNNSLGSPNASLPNLISGNLGAGVLVENSNYNLFQNNLIGGTRGSISVPNLGNGITLLNGQGNLVGGDSAGNVISGNLGDGVALVGGASNQVSENSMVGNRAGIVLSAGANASQVAPVLASARPFPSADRVLIAGALLSGPNRTYRIEFFSNQTTNGAYEGQTYLGYTFVQTDGSGRAAFEVNFPQGEVSGTVFTATATNWQTRDTSEFSGPVVLNFAEIVAAGTGPGVRPEVKVYKAGTDILLTTLHPFQAEYLGGLNVAVGDLNEDGIPEVIVASGGGAQATIQVFDTVTASVISSFYVFPGYAGPVSIASGDVNGDGMADLVACSGDGSRATVAVLDAQTRVTLGSFYAFGGGALTGGTVAVGDLDADGVKEIIVGGGAGNQALVKVFGVVDGEWAARGQFNAFANYNGGVNVAAGILSDAGTLQILCGSTGSAVGTVTVFDGATLENLKSFWAYGERYRGAVSVAAFDLNGPGKGGGIVTGTGTGAPPQLVQFRYSNLSALQSFYAYPVGMTKGLSVAGSIADILFSQPQPPV